MLFRSLFSAAGEIVPDKNSTEKRIGNYTLKDMDDGQGGKVKRIDPASVTGALHKRGIEVANASGQFIGTGITIFGVEGKLYDQFGREKQIVAWDATYGPQGPVRQGFIAEGEFTYKNIPEPAFMRGMRVEGLQGFSITSLLIKTGKEEEPAGKREIGRASCRERV